MTKLTTAAWLAAAAIGFSGCADTSETDGNSPDPATAAATPAAVQPPGGAAAAGDIDNAAHVEEPHAGADDPSTTTNAPPQPDGTPAAAGKKSGGGAKPGSAITTARVVPGAAPIPGAEGDAVSGGSSGLDGVAAAPSKAVISANTGVAEFTIILLDRIRRKIDKKRGRSSPDRARTGTLQP